MARKRMFDNDIINQDKFLDLPIETKALYFLLGMDADDEGFIAPKKIMRLHGISEDNLKILIAKNYVIQFESGVVVITDWKRNNYLDKNKIKRTIYVDEKNLLEYDKEKQQYVLNPVIPIVKLKLNESLTKVKQKLTQNSIDKYSIDKYSIDNNIINNNNNINNNINNIIKYYEENIGMITPASADLLLSYLDDGLDSLLIIEAIKIATLSNKRNTKYINGILKNWKNKGYKVIADLENEKKAVTNKTSGRDYEESYLNDFYSN